MLKIAGAEVNPKVIGSQYAEDSIENKIINKMASSRETFKYSSLNQLYFEVNMRKNIIAASRELNDSHMKFKVFKKSYCNKDYWDRTKEGGFKQREDVTISEGIDDIFKNSKEYGTECSTAIVIVYYRAIQNIYPEELFDKTFEGITLLNWHHFDDDLNVYSYEIEGDFIPGDCLYFENPDYDPKEAEWQGENAIDLGDGTYYGHGIGITDSESIIKDLNKHRKRDAEKSAYLSKFVARPNFKDLADIYLSSLERMRKSFFPGCPFCK